MAADEAADFTSAHLARERLIAEAIAVDAGSLVQAGLFDRRAERARSMARAAIDETVDTINRRIDGGRLGGLSQRPARLLLVLVS